MYLKSTDGGNSGGNGEDKYGFSALPGGLRNDIFFSWVGIYGRWWSSSEHNGIVYAMGIDYKYGYVFYSSFYRGLLFSIRCVKD